MFLDVSLLSKCFENQNDSLFLQKYAGDGK